MGGIPIRNPYMEILEMKLNFEIFGAFDIPRLKSDRDEIDTCALIDWWAGHESRVGMPLGISLGCYIFSMRSGGGTLPWYVGKTEISFRQECFQPHKLRHYERIMRNNAKGTPQLTLIANVTPGGKPVKPSKNGHSQIEFLEKYLIMECLRRNDELVNSKNTALLRKIKVPGVVNPARGKPSTEAQELAKLIRG